MFATSLSCMLDERRKSSSARIGRAAAAIDVARRAGVSIATVSRVINQVGPVRDETRHRVEQAARDLDYSPNSFARSLALRSSKTIGVVVPSLRGSIFASGVEAIQRHAEAAGYSILLAFSDYSLERELDMARTLVSRGTDGLILVGTLHHPELRPFLEKRGIPYVCQGALKGGSEHPCVGFDNARVISVIVEHLLALGHKRFAVVAGIASANDRVANRIDGIRRALADAALELDPELLVECRYELGAACEGMRHILATGKGPTAVVCINDVLAHGAILECQAQGLTVPGDISITGFDDLEFAAHVRPGITTLRVSTDQMGTAAIEQLMARIAGNRRPRRNVEVPTELIVRGSTARPPANPTRRRKTRRTAEQ